MLLQSSDAFEEPAGVEGECVTLDVSATTVRRHKAALGIPATEWQYRRNSEAARTLHEQPTALVGLPGSSG
jgi:hypothetical protein